MKTRSLILATILPIPGTLAITIESALAQMPRPIGRAYSLPAPPSTALSFPEDSPGDSIPELAITRFPQPRFEFSILTELDGQPIIDQDNRSDFGLFPNAIPSFTYVEDTQIITLRIADDQGNPIPSQEISNEIIPGVPNTFFNGDLKVEQINNSATDSPFIYEFNFGEDFVQFFLPEFDDIDSSLAVNDISYLVNENLFGQEILLDNLLVVDTSFTDNRLSINTNEAESSLLFASQSVPESNNVLRLLTLGAISLTSLTKYRVNKS